MKKLFAAIIALTLILSGLAAMAEETGTAELEINTLVEDNSFIVQIIDVPDEGWFAEVVKGDGDVITLYDADIIEDTFVARFDAVADGEATVNVRHYYNACACDRDLIWELVIENGVPESVSSQDTYMALDESSDERMLGEWTQIDAPYAEMTIEKNEYIGWDVCVVSPSEAGGIVFKTTIYPDVHTEACVYDKGKYWKVEITDSEDAPELGEADIAGATGKFAIQSAGEDISIVWTEDSDPEGSTVFTRAAQDDETVEDAYYTFEGSNVSMIIPADFESVSDNPYDGTFYNCSNADVLLQVIPADGDFADAEAVKAYYDEWELIDSSEVTEINGLELVRAHGEEDATIIAVVSPEGTTYQFVFIPQHEDAQDAIDAIVSTICPSDAIPGAGRLIMPMSEEIDLENLADGIYSASFDPADIDDGELNVTIYTVETFDIVDISELMVGDYIVIEGTPIEIESLERADDIYINGTEGIVLRAYDEDNCWRVAGDDDYPTWTEQGVAVLPLSDDVTLTDGWDIANGPVTVTGKDEVIDYVLTNGNEWFDLYSTKVRVENGGIVEIVREYVP